MCSVTPHETNARTQNYLYTCSKWTTYVQVGRQLNIQLCMIDTKNNVDSRQSSDPTCVLLTGEEFFKWGTLTNFGNLNSKLPGSTSFSIVWLTNDPEMRSGCFRISARYRDIRENVSSQLLTHRLTCVQRSASVFKIKYNIFSIPFR